MVQPARQRSISQSLRFTCVSFGEIELATMVEYYAVQLIDCRTSSIYIPVAHIPRIQLGFFFC